MTDSSEQSANQDESEANLEQQTGGFEGQAGYRSHFVDGVYQNPDIADANQLEDRAGSHEDGYGPSLQGDALQPMTPRDAPEIGGNQPSNNYTEGREVDDSGKQIVEE